MNRYHVALNIYCALIAGGATSDDGTDWLIQHAFERADEFMDEVNRQAAEAEERSARMGW